MSRGNQRDKDREVSVCVIYFLEFLTRMYLYIYIHPLDESGNLTSNDPWQRAAQRSKASSGKTKGDPTAKREADAKALQDKIARKKAAQEAGGAATGDGKTGSKGKGKK